MDDHRHQQCELYGFSYAQAEVFKRLGCSDSANRALDS